MIRDASRLACRFPTRGNLRRRPSGGRLRDRPHFPGLRRDSVRKIDLPAPLETVNVHDDFGRSGGQVGRLPQADFLWADGGEFERFAANKEVQADVCGIAA